ncbi:autoinducer binding domain-containing protein [Oceaniglobus ichthyenteri]|uniref:autoinducer binding domain-containing protein n=1 Tax=Oceaniglobus ichthyenteri TaxID=2136177 RepID=UPI000D33AE04|nr:autoinducer binding domain-containing protein [Oceaniglobus ichthyenteri]
MFEQRLFDEELKKLDPYAEAGYFLALHIRFTSPVMMFQTYDPAWINHYTENGYVLRDPMTAWSFSATGTTRWSNRRIPDPFGIFKKARQFGLNYGATISHGPIRSRTVCSMARSDREFEDHEMAELARLVAILHDMSDPRQRLTKAQTQALKCIADGMRHAAAAEFLGISESALKLRLAGARDRLLARTTAEAIQRAKENNLL